MNANPPGIDPSNPDQPTASRARHQPRVISLPDGVEILNKTEVARRLGVTERHIEHLIKRRRIPHLRLGTKALRFIWSEVVRGLSVHGGDSGSEAVQ